MNPQPDVFASSATRQSLRSDHPTAALPHTLCPIPGPSRHLFSVPSVCSVVKLFVVLYVTVTLTAAPARAAGGALKFGAISYRRAYSDARIPGMGADERMLGGRLYVGLHNAGKAPLRIGKLTLNGTDADALTRAEKLYWWRRWPEQIAPGAVSTLTLVGGAPLLQEGAQLKLSVRASDGSTASGTFDLITPALKLAYAVPEGDRAQPGGGWHTLLVWLRNDDDLNTLRLREVAIAGVRSSAEMLCDTIAPGRSTIVRLRLAEPLHFLQPLQLIARARDQRGRAVECMAPLRALVPPFPIGTWVGPTADPAHLDALARIGIDGLINGGDEAHVKAMDGLYQKYGFGLLSHCGWGPGNVRPFVLDTVAPKPWCLALALMDEPDLHRGKETGNMRSSLFTYLGGVEVWRRCTVRPTFVNLCDNSKFGEFVGMTDILGYDAYAVGAPGIELSHVGYARDLESAAYFTWDLKRNAEPSPIWVWGQGYHAWVYRLLAGMMMTGQPGRAMVTPSECRLQLIEQLGRGAKGLWWFLALSKEGTRAGFESELKDEAAQFGVTKDRLPALVDKAMEPWDELWAELGHLNSMVRQIRPLLTYADPYQQFVHQARWTGRADVATVAGENALVIFAANLNYYHTLQGALFRPINGLSLTVERPKWLAPRDVFEVTPEGPRDVKWSAEGGSLKIDAGTLTDIKVFVASASPAMRKQMTECALGR
jgi:hypothetical protein